MPLPCVPLVPEVPGDLVYLEYRGHPEDIYIHDQNIKQVCQSKKIDMINQIWNIIHPMNVSDHVTYGGSPSPGVSWITLWTKSIKSISRISLQRKWNILNYIVLTGKTGVNGVRLCN